MKKGLIRRWLQHRAADCFFHRIATYDQWIQNKSHFITGSIRYIYWWITTYDIYYRNKFLSSSLEKAIIFRDFNYTARKRLVTWRLEHVKDFRTISKSSIHTLDHINYFLRLSTLTERTWDAFGAYLGLLPLSVVFSRTTSNGLAHVDCFRLLPRV